ncbi:MAG: ATP-binding protein [Algicola sp.]|nr:ATP-binding protein [Algicola sp.]
MKYPLGIQTFSEIREENYLYVDKTALVHQLIQSGKVYFLSRPRRFGKSLLISTFESLFSGHKALFDGLAIANTDYDFAEYPVISLEFSKVDVSEASDLKGYIINATNQYAEAYGIELTIDSYEQRFEELVRRLQEKTGKKVVLLVDEYDKPILDNLFNEALKPVKGVMKSFYAVVKSLDKYLKFIFITGVSKFAKLSVFSGMNNLTDISLNRRYATLCGVTQQELESHFSDAIDELASLELLGSAQMLAKIKHWYNGYQFHQSAVGIYNPYSVLSLFEHQEFLNYWFTTATPTFLLDLLQNREYDLKELTQFEVGEASLAACEPEQMEVQSVFLQTGYLTIKGYDGSLYSLDFPNYEVKKSFYDSVAGRYSNLGAGVGQNFTQRLIRHLNAGQLDDFFETLGQFFANIPYDITLKDEKYYQSLFYAIFTLIGLSIEAEVRTNKGRIDCVLETKDTIYIIEFKLNGSKEDALQQIHDKQYAQKYQGGDKKVVLLGVEFDKESRNLGGFVLVDG